MLNIETIKAGIEAPFIACQISTLGGSATILIAVSLDPKETWQNGIFENSRYFHMSIDSNFKMEVFSNSNPDGKGNYTHPKFRKCTIKNEAHAIEKINAYIATF